MRKLLTCLITFGLCCFLSGCGHEKMNNETDVEELSVYVNDSRFMNEIGLQVNPNVITDLGVQQAENVITDSDRQPTTDVINDDAEKKNAEVDAMPDSIRAVIEEEAEFIDAYTQNVFTRQSYNFEGGYEFDEDNLYEPLPWVEYTVNDLNGDGLCEAIVLISNASGSKCYYAILSELSGKVYAYRVVYRGLCPLFADGRIGESSGASYGGYYRIVAFDSDGFEEEILAEIHDDKFFVSGEAASEQDFYDYCAEVLATDRATWIELE